MAGGVSVPNARSRRLSFIVVVSVFATCTSVGGHQARNGVTIGVMIPSITHGAMPIVAKYRSEILDLTATQSHTDGTLRRLTSFVNLQYFVCFWGVVPGSVTNERSPFNECSHAYLAGVRALLAYMATMPGDQSEAKILDSRINAEITSEPAIASLCLNSDTTFDSGLIVKPDLRLVASDMPTVAIFFTAMVLILGGLGYFSRAALTSKAVARSNR